MSNRFKRAADQKKVSPGGNTEKEVTPTKIGDALADMLPKKEEGKSYSFYLSSESFAKLEKFSKENGCSRSKAIDIIIKNFL